MTTEAQMGEIERAMLCVEHAIERIRSASVTLKKSDADRHLIDALDAADTQITLAWRRLMQETYWGGFDVWLHEQRGRGAPREGV